ncbi:NUDIX domain-containing protein [Thermosulfurimonas dismutans]|uniref:ADP-ribose pyrophosphatase n=1 Tax=Thermosulfurimonas dismutans TaxID=999894 RepID=A0A179D7D7_9BACT|nr:NUDIX hydrolase [Thermosulfurimonas dismutans]OAQ21518.1 ADP-ribose pyrophosphatase [Thermosulfurimonas dismutans]
MKSHFICPYCGKEIEKYRNPFLTVDIIIETPGGIILIKRKNPPYGWALPGGFVDYGESLEEAAVREAKEETGLEVELLCQLYTYSRPGRDPRFHTITTVYVARAEGHPKGGDDAAEAKVFSEKEIPWGELAFDHAEILKDYFEVKNVKESHSGTTHQTKLPRCR